MEAVPEFNYQVEPNPKPEKVGYVDLKVTLVIPINMEPILTRSSFSCSLLVREFIEDEDYPHKQQLHYFLTESGVDELDAVGLILKFIRLAREVTSSVIYCPRYALFMWLTLDVVPLREEASCLDEARGLYIDDYRFEEKIHASVDDYVESYMDELQIQEVIQAPFDEYEESLFLDEFQNEEMIQEESLFYDSQIEEVIPMSLVEYKFKPASKLKVKSLKRKTYKKKRETICKIYKNKRQTSSIDERCTICLEKFDSKREIVTLPCGHVFDSECIVEWLGIGHVCPLCRFEFPCEADEIHKTQITKVF